MTDILDKDYLLKVKIQNNKIVKLMREKNITSASMLARLANISPTEVTRIINMQITPLSSDKRLNSTNQFWKTAVLKIARVLGVLPEHMFNQQQLYMPLETNSAEKELDFEQITALLPHDMQTLTIEDASANAIRDELVKQSLAVMTPKERAFVEEYFGIGDEQAESLNELGKKYGVSQTRGPNYCKRMSNSQICIARSR